MSALLTSLALSLVAHVPSEPWTFASPLTAGAKLAWRINSKVEVEGNEMTAVLTKRMVVKSLDSGKATAHISWDDLSVDGQDMGTIGAWDVVVNADGTLHKVAADEDDLRRMLMVFAVSVPNGKPVEIGSKWEVTAAVENKLARKVTHSYEAVAEESVKTVPTLKIKGKIVESGSDPVTVQGHWWVSKDGIVQKFEIEVANWPVPVAGPNLMKGNITGELTKF